MEPEWPLCFVVAILVNVWPTHAAARVHVSPTLVLLSAMLMPLALVSISIRPAERCAPTDTFTASNLEPIV